MNTLSMQKIILSLALTISIATHTMDTLKNVLSAIGEETSYMIGAPIISTIQSIKTYTELAVFSSSPKMRALGIKTAQNRRNFIKQNIKHKEKETIDAIYDDFNITKDQQEALSEIIQQFKQAEKKWLTSDHKEFNHDQDFPEEIMPILKKNNIKPSAMRLIVDTKCRNDRALASANMMQAEISQDGNTFNIQRTLESPSITIYPSFNNSSCLLDLVSSSYATNSKKAMLIHEVGHIKIHHDAQYKLIAFFAASIDREKFTRHGDFQQLNIIHEQQTELFSAIEDLHDASILRLYRQINAYPQTLHLTHFAQLSAIDDSHHLERHLKSKQIPIQKIDTLRTMKFNAPLQHQQFAGPQ